MTFATPPTPLICAPGLGLEWCRGGLRLQLLAPGLAVPAPVGKALAEVPAYLPPISGLAGLKAVFPSAGRLDPCVSRGVAAYGAGTCPGGAGADIDCCPR